MAKTYTPSGLLQDLTLTVDGDECRWDWKSWSLLQVPYNGFPKFTWKREGTLPKFWHPRWGTHAAVFNQMFYPQLGPLPDLDRQDYEDVRRDHGATGDGGRELEAPAFPYVMSDDPGSVQTGLNALSMWNLDQLNRPFGHGEPYEVHAGNKDPKLTKPFINHGDREWKAERQGQNGWDAYDKAHWHRVKVFALACIKHPLGLANAANGWSWMGQDLNGTNGGIGVQPRASQILQEAMFAHFLKLDHDESWVQDRCGGVRPLDLLNDQITRLSEDFWPVYEKSWGQKLASGIADLSEEGYEGEIEYAQNFHLCLMLNVLGKLHVFCGVVPEMRQRQDEVKAIADRIIDWMVGRRILTRDGLKSQVSSCRAWPEEECRRRLELARPKQSKPLEMVKSWDPEEQGLWLIRSVPKEGDTQLLASAWAYWMGTDDVWLKEWLKRKAAVEAEPKYVLWLHRQLEDAEANAENPWSMSQAG